MGDNRTFVATIASRHGRRLQRFLSRRLQNRADAPDLAQEVYLRLLRIERCEEIRSPEAYLLSVAGNLPREHALRQASAPSVVDVDDLVSELRTLPQDDPSARAEIEQRLVAIEQALGKLSPKAHAALLLHRRDGFSIEEIAGMLGISRSMAKKYLTGALAHCRKRLERMEGE